MASCPDRETVDRYLLGELSEQERDQWEAHAFECATCAEEVRLGAALIEGARRARRTSEERPGLAWLRAPWPAAARATAAVAGALLLVSGYQGLVALPRLRSEIAAQDRPRVITPTALRPATRGAVAQGPTVTVSPDQRHALVTVLPEGPDVTGYRARVLTPTEAVVVPPFDVPARDPLYLQLPVAHLVPGPYLLELVPQTDGNFGRAARYRFVLDRK
jgi:hypothetical protein